MPLTIPSNLTNMPVPDYQTDPVTGSSGETYGLRNAFLTCILAQDDGAGAGPTPYRIERSIANGSWTINDAEDCGATQRATMSTKIRVIEPSTVAGYDFTPAVSAARGILVNDFSAYLAFVEEALWSTIGGTPSEAAPPPGFSAVMGGYIRNDVLLPLDPAPAFEVRLSRARVAKSSILSSDPLACELKDMFKVSAAASLDILLPYPLCTRVPIANMSAKFTFMGDTYEENDLLVAGGSLPTNVWSYPD